MDTPSPVFPIIPLAAYDVVSRVAYSVSPDPSYPDINIGIEIEVENCPKVLVPGWVWHEENSLRSEENSEYVTRGVIAAGHCADSLYHLFGKLPEGYSFSPACSTHVHVDVRGFSIEQLAVIFLTYTSVEDLLFEFAGVYRRGNNYCTPWSEAGYGNIFQGWDYRWVNIYSEKYAALNFLPVRNMHQGSVEFRHFPGASDVPKLCGWIKLVTRLVEYASKQTYKDQLSALAALKVASNTSAYLESIFGDAAPLLQGNMKMLPLRAKQLLAALSFNSQVIPCTPRSSLSVKLKLAANAKVKKPAAVQGGAARRRAQERLAMLAHPDGPAAMPFLGGPVFDVGGIARPALVVPDARPAELDRLLRQGDVREQLRDFLVLDEERDV